MRALKTRLSTLSVPLAAAVIAAGAAQACGPMGGGDSGSSQAGPSQGGSYQGGSYQGGAPQGEPNPGGYGRSSQASDGGGGSSGGWDNGGADRMRQGVDDATRTESDDEGGGRRAWGGGSSNGGGGGADFSSQISALGAVDTKNEHASQPSQAAVPHEEDDGHTGGGNSVWWTVLTGDNGLEHSLTDRINANAPPDPRYEAQMDKPWYQRASEAWEAINPPGHEIAETGQDSGERSLLDHPPAGSLAAQPLPLAEEWKAYNDLPWYQRWTTPNPDVQRNMNQPQPPQPNLHGMQPRHGSRG